MSIENKSPKHHHPMWEKPKHHEFAHEKTHQVHWIELFYDLVHVVAIFLLGSFLTDNLNLLGFGIFTLLFIAIWVSWGDYVFYNSLYVSRDYKHRLISAFHITTVMLMAASIPSITSGGFSFFLGAYGVNRIITSLLYFRARKFNTFSKTLASEMFSRFFIIGTLILISAFLPSPMSFLIVTLGIIAIQLVYILPKYGVMRFENFTPRMHPLSERFALLLLISLGEGFFKMVLELVNKGIYNISLDIFINYILGGVLLFLIAWMYFDFVGNMPVKNHEKKTIMKWWYSHMALMFFAILIGIALKGEVKVYFTDPYPLGLALLGCFGFIGFLLTLEVIQENVLKNVSRKFATFKVKLFGIFFVILTLITVYYSMPSILSNILFTIGVGSQLLIPISKAYLHFKKDIEKMHEEQKLIELKEE